MCKFCAMSDSTPGIETKMISVEIISHSLLWKKKHLSHKMESKVRSPSTPCCFLNIPESVFKRLEWKKNPKSKTCHYIGTKMLKFSSCTSWPFTSSKARVDTVTSTYIAVPSVHMFYAFWQDVCRLKCWQSHMLVKSALTRTEHNALA